MKHTALLLLLLIMSACSTQEQKRFSFIDYPNLKLGFTTQNFIEAVPVSFNNAKKFINYASETGYHWIELRDPEASLTSEECRQLAKYAIDKQIEVGYAIQKGLLDVDYWEVFDRGLVNAAHFINNGPVTYRSLACGKEFDLDSTKLGWTKEEFEHVVANAKIAAQKANALGLQFVVENGNEAFMGQSNAYFGLSNLIDTTHSDIGWQFDSANPFSGSRVTPSVDEVKTFLNNHISRLHYIHLKSSVDNAAQTYLTNNPLPFDVIFKAMDTHVIPYVAIELQAIDDESAIYQNMNASIQYLIQEGYLSPPNRP